MQCAYCKETIDDDSYYCDLCGEEAKLCPGCLKTGKGKACTSCGTTLILAKDMSTNASAGSSDAGTGSVAPDPPPVHVASSPLQDTPAGGTVRLDDCPPGASSAPPELRLMNKNLNIDLPIQNNSVLGRATGNYVSTFGSFNQVSSKHCSFSFDTVKGWCATDHGSTNGTKLNDAPLSPNTLQPLKDQMFLKIANIEFYVQIK